MQQSNTKNFQKFGTMLKGRVPQHEYRFNPQKSYEQIIYDHTRFTDIRERALNLDEIGELAKAIQDFTLVISIRPNDWRSFMSRGWAWVALREYHKALGDF